MTTLRSESKAEKIIELRAQGFSVRQIATLLGLSTQGVYWHLNADKRKREETHGSS